MLTLLVDVPSDTTIDLDSWDGIALVGAMRDAKAAEIPWWQLAPMNRFVSLIFGALQFRNDDEVLRFLPGFLDDTSRERSGEGRGWKEEEKKDEINVKR